MSVVIDGSAGVTTASGAVYNGLQTATAQASTSGTSIDFTSIPSWVKRITVIFNQVSLSGTSSFLVRVGNGTPATSGYSSITTYNAVSSIGGLASSAGFIIQGADSTYAIYGSLTITNISGNTWIASGVIGNSATTSFTVNTAGTIALGSVLNMVRITTVNGTDTFDAGSINIIYE